MVGLQVSFISFHTQVLLFLNAVHKAGITYDEKLFFPLGPEHTVPILTLALAAGQEVILRMWGEEMDVSYVGDGQDP